MRCSNSGICLSAVAMNMLVGIEKAVFAAGAPGLHSVRVLARQPCLGARSRTGPARRVSSLTPSRLKTSPGP